MPQTSLASQQQQPTSLLRANWESLLLVWLHDPFDKALDIRGHERRAARYASAALGREVSRSEMKAAAGTADPFAAAAERVPAPTAGRGGERAVGPEDGLQFIHPLSGSVTELDCPRPAPEDVDRTIVSIVDRLDSPRERFLALWRLLPDRVSEKFGADAARLPADTRFPDHTLFQHADTAAGLSTALSGGHGAAFLSFSMGPIQPFIAAARTVRDLWSGSAVLSWLSFSAMTPVLSLYGPTAFIYPALRGTPLLDLWLRQQGDVAAILPEPGPDGKRAPSLPNRFVAVVPAGPNGEHAAELGRQCREAGRAAWEELARSVKSALAPKLDELDPTWARFWDHQIGGVLDFRCAAVPERDLREDRLAALSGKGAFGKVWPYAASIRKLAEAIPEEMRPRYRQDSAGRWQAEMDYVARLLAAERSVRLVPRAAPGSEDRAPRKCSLFGNWEQLGPSALSEASSFWEQAASRLALGGVRLREGERLCAAALTKRYAGPAYLAPMLGLSTAGLRFPDTATIAAARWLDRAGIAPDRERQKHRRWSGQWLHRPQREAREDEDAVPEDLWRRLREAVHQEEHGKPPTYYAVLAMDGDRIGRWLAGAMSLPVRSSMHPKMRDWYESLGGPHVPEALQAKRHVTPALHATISSALGSFATETAPAIVRRHSGTIIYCGGDDLLALSPVETSLALVYDLRQAFSGTDEASQSGFRHSGDRLRMTMGRHATMSAGLAIVHHKEDLRGALEAARGAEALAKKEGKDRLRMIAMRRSGEHQACTCPWSLAPRVDALRRQFAAGASSRWTYRLRAESEALGHTLPKEAQCAEIRRLVDRSEDVRSGDRDRGRQMATLYQDFLELRGGPSDNEGDGGPPAAPDALADFTALCQTAAFMARGRDD